jgi:hypothetical protein
VNEQRQTDQDERGAQEHQQKSGTDMVPASMNAGHSPLR